MATLTARTAGRKLLWQVGIEEQRELFGERGVVDVVRVDVEAVEEGLVELPSRWPVRDRVGTLAIGGEIECLV